MKEIPLTQGKVAFVDDADFESVSTFKWRADKSRRTFYATRDIKRGGVWTTTTMHQFLLPGVPQIDHRNGNGLDNQRRNIRPATASQNGQSFQRKRTTASSRFRGVNLHTKGKWVARIRAEGKERYLGYFASEIDAARAYDNAARKYFGDFSAPNFNLSNEPNLK